MTSRRGAKAQRQSRLSAPPRLCVRFFIHSDLGFHSVYKLRISNFRDSAVTEEV